MPVESINLPCWRFNGSVDGMPDWLRDPGHAVSEATPTELLSAGRQPVPGEPVLRLADGRTMAVGDYAVRHPAGGAPIVMHGREFDIRHGARA